MVDGSGPGFKPDFDVKRHWFLGAMEGKTLVVSALERALSDDDCLGIGPACPVAIDQSISGCAHGRAIQVCRRFAVDAQLQFGDDAAVAVEQTSGLFPSNGPIGSRH